ncbi:MAG: hypothetical protein WKF37_07565 [Bryobacteraceae bacterium]
MKNSLRLSLFAVLSALATTASAAPMCMTSGTYADLLMTNSGGGCMINDKLFSDFSFGASASGGAMVATASSFGYNVIANVPTDIGFRFNFSMAAFGGQSSDVLLGYLVTGPNITSNHLAMAGGTLGGGVASVSETYCKGASITSCQPSQASSFFASSGSRL